MQKMVKILVLITLEILATRTPSFTFPNTPNSTQEPQRISFILA